jgi:glutathione S-transferase
MTCTLYSGTRNASSWAMRAWLALREQNIEFEEHIIDLRKPQRFKQLAMVGEISPAASVPVLVTGSAIIFDSSTIMEFASEQGKQSLLPDDMELRTRARSFVAYGLGSE